MSKLLVIQVAALGWDLVADDESVVSELGFRPVESIFPALTCVAQATLRTASLPADHGMIANGRYVRELRTPMFWEQAASLVHGPRIWDAAREQGRRVGMMFWQQSLGEQVDLVLSPRPIHKHGGGMIQDCYGAPENLYASLRSAIGRSFNLMHYWGPMTSRKSSDWIVSALEAVMTDASLAPDLLFGYIPHLDYDLQKFGPGSPRALRALGMTLDYLRTLGEVAQRQGWETLFVGDYAIGPVTGPVVFPNRVLREAGLFRIQAVKGRAYPDFFASPALAMVDHEVAHVFVQDASRLRQVRDLLASCDGVAAVLDADGQADVGMGGPHAGELLLAAEPGSWFAYPWWRDRQEAPDFAAHVDIHNKPGFDPCELFFGWPPMSVSQDVTRIRGTHGTAGAGRRVACGGSLHLPEQPDTFLGVARALASYLGVSKPGSGG